MEASRAATGMFGSVGDQNGPLHDGLTSRWIDQFWKFISERPSFHFHVPHNQRKLRCLHWQTWPPGVHNCFPAPKGPGTAAAPRFGHREEGIDDR